MLIEHFMQAESETAIPIASIERHLMWLLNTRQGSLVHHPDYGLPDLTAIYADLPHSIQQLKQAIQLAISQYEPRLSHVRIVQHQVQDEDYVLQLDIQARVKQLGVVNFATVFNSSGHAEIYPEVGVSYA